jgi:DNA-binding CsgD family transcriptional regulator/predicted negative regulator of RcsB-dependent stress response
MAATPRDRTPRSSARRDWNAEYAALSARDRKTPLDPADLEQLGITAYLAGREPVSIDILTRAHTAALERGETRQAARAAFWIAFALIGGRELARAAGWGARGRRLLEPEHVDCVECGLLMLPQALEHVSCGDLAGAEAVFAAAERIGERFADADLTSLARQGRGRVLVGLGRVAEGVALFDEVMVAVTAGEVTPIVAGTVYCSVIGACFEMLDIRRAQEWTAALSDWCEAQPGLVPYRGDCLAHRAEIFRLRGRWPEAREEARRAYDALMGTKAPGEGAAVYALAELHRLQGEMTAAEDAYRLASAHGRATHPGLALLRLAQGQPEAARAAIDRLMAEPARGRQRADLLVAATEVFLASGDVAAAGRAAEELNVIAGALHSEALRAMAAVAAGAVHLADGQAHQALAPLRAALAIWRDLDVPYEAARVAVLVGRACRALGDADGARMEWEAAAGIFRQFGAAPALADVEALLQSPAATTRPAGGGLTAREMEVLRLVARGKTNRAIAKELGISDKTVARHVSNIFVKLDLSTRAAATAYAFTHRLLRQDVTPT